MYYNIDTLSQTLFQPVVTSCMNMILLPRAVEYHCIILSHHSMYVQCIYCTIKVVTFPNELC